MSNRSSPKLPPPQLSSQSETIIDGYILRWPKFQIHNAIFEGKLFTIAVCSVVENILAIKGQSYSIANTCNVDSGLFVLYYLYRTDVTFTQDILDAPGDSPCVLLRKTFDLVETEGWDIARIFWLLTNNRIKKSGRKIKNIFGSLDENVFRTIKRQQRYSFTKVCSRPECKQKKRTTINTELSAE